MQAMEVAGHQFAHDEVAPQLVGHARLLQLAQQGVRLRELGQRELVQHGVGATRSGIGATGATI